MISDEKSRLTQIARDALTPLGAFVRMDRGDALLVSDAPRRGAEIPKALEADFETRLSGGLLYLTPRLTRIPQRLRGIFLSAMKADAEERETLLRKALAESMRLRNADEIEFLTKIWEDERLC